MSRLVYDAPALLAVMFNERSSERTIELLAQAGDEVSAVNWSEAAAKLTDRWLGADEAATELATFGLHVVAFDEEQATIAAALRLLTRDLGLSLGDRCCHALARAGKARVVTANIAWLEVRGFDVIAIRDSRSSYVRQSRHAWRYAKPA